MFNRKDWGSKIYENQSKTDEFCLQKIMTSVHYTFFEVINKCENILNKKVAIL